MIETTRPAVTMTSSTTFLGLATFIVACIYARHATSTNIAITISKRSDKSEVLRYLEKYGYMSSDDTSLTYTNTTTSPTIRHAISRFQEFYGLPVAVLQTMLLFE